MQVGIVGLPLSGKTTLFNALTKGHADIDSFGGAKHDSHLSVVKVPDERLEVLKEIFQPQKLTPTTVQYVDVAGLEKGISEKGGLCAYLCPRKTCWELALRKDRLDYGAQHRFR